jgi:hypothetical protein
MLPRFFPAMTHTVATRLSLIDQRAGRGKYELEPFGAGMTGLPDRRCTTKEIQSSGNTAVEDEI